MYTLKEHARSRRLAYEQKRSNKQ